MSESKEEKAKRLADALRANLRRRKGQAKDRGDSPAQPAQDKPRD